MAILHQEAFKVHFDLLLEINRGAGLSYTWAASGGDIAPQKVKAPFSGDMVFCRVF